MSIRFSCAQCGTAFAVGEQFAGKRVKCNGCGVLMTVPAATAAPVAPGAAPPPLPGDACPACHGSLPQGAVLCTACGFDLRTGHRLTTRTEAPPPYLMGTDPSRVVWGVLGGLALVVALAVGIGVLGGAIIRQQNLQRARYARPTRFAQGLQPPFYQSPSSAQRAGPGIDVYPTRIEGSGPGLPMEIEVYLPTGRHQPRSLPCVFVAPAGTRLLYGSELSAGDAAEHLPYAREGFAVVAYELSGNFNEPPRVTLGSMAGPIRQFMAADGGLANARAAIDYVLKQVPEVDPDRLYATGHSSAATTALNLAAADHRIKACCAYAPVCDVPAGWRRNLPSMERLVPGVSDFAARVSPVRHINEFSCPIYLFHADDDEVVALADNQQFADALKRARKQVTFVRAPSGGHYQSMISQGIPGAIEWLKELGAKPLPPLAEGSAAPR